jgi:hypothetical protein
MDADVQAAIQALREEMMTLFQSVVPRAFFAIEDGSAVITSSGYVDASPAGPTVSQLPPGVYVFLFGARANPQSTSSIATVGLFVNGSVQTSALAQRLGDVTQDTASQIQVEIAGGWLQTLTADTNTATLKYLSASATTAAGFSKRWMLALRIGT